RSLMDAGLTVAGGSDSPIERLSPFAGIYAAATRGRFEGRQILRYSERERLTTEQALGLYTHNGASACLEDNLMGSVQPGKCGDLTVVAGDPTDVPPHRLKDLKVVMTVVAGKVAYSLRDESINR
ncbi:MAG: amidohydrolase family protein, partial [Aigarchaeota archaeon]|nr:amidohydrolase family protein [Aigarchaeota archaeon]